MSSSRLWTRADLELLEFAPDAIVVVDARGRIVFANTATEDVFGYAPRELNGQSIEVLVPEGSREQHRKERLHFERHPHSRPMSAGLDLTGRHKNGREVPVDISLSPLETDHGHIVIAAVRDISARRRMELELRDANQKLRADLDVAARIQHSLLPITTPQAQGIRFAWVFEPCERLAGDSFNVFGIDADHVGVYLLDVCGHGVPAALHAVALTRLLAAAPWPSSAVSKDASPAAIARHLNGEFPMDLETWKYFTFLCGVVDLERQELRYVTAGHPGPVRVTKSGAERLAAGGLPIGLFADADYEEYVTKLSPGDRIVLHSDGITEAMNPDEEEYGDRPFLEALTHAGGQPLKTSLESVVAEVRRWRRCDDFDDDLSLIAFEMPPS